MLSIAERTENYYTVSTPGNVGEPAQTFMEIGTEYTVSLRVRLHADEEAPQPVRLTNNENYQMVLYEDGVTNTPHCSI